MVSPYNVFATRAVILPTSYRRCSDIVWIARVAQTLHRDMVKHPPRPHRAVVFSGSVRAFDKCYKKAYRKKNLRQPQVNCTGVLPCPHARLWLSPPYSKWMQLASFSTEKHALMARPDLAKKIPQICVRRRCFAVSPSKVLAARVFLQTGAKQNTCVAHLRATREFFSCFFCKVGAGH